MTRLRTNLLIDIIMLVVFIPSLISGIILWLVPQGYQGGRWVTGSILIGLSRSSWSGIHTITGFALAALIVLHLVFHIPQIRNAGKILRRPSGEPDVS
ncbi:MAG: DUF4405 domain-containing protein [Methanomicrobiales archaeon]|nr:DUF4405 domain-containing protein [Methanomicrobiales archaeon]